MTAQPKTLSLAPREWNALLASNAEDMANLFKSQPMPTPVLYQQIADHLERMKMILPGWLASAPKVEAPVVNDSSQVPLHQEANGATAPKKRGRKSNAEKAAMAAQGMQ